MAEATAMRNNALPYPVYGAPYTIVVALKTTAGAAISPSSADSEISKNGDTASDCTNELTEISGTTGVCYLTLTGTELTCDVAALEMTSTGAATEVAVLYPRKLATERAGTSASGGVSTSTIVLDASASSIDDYYNGMLCIATIDSNIEARIISDYTGSTQTATVVPDWNVAPDNNDTFVIKIPDAFAAHPAVVKALTVDTYAEPGQGNPAATTDLKTKVGFLYKAWRNKNTATASEYALYADDGTTKDQEATLADDATTFTRGEVSTGA